MPNARYENFTEDATNTDGAARKKPGRVTVRYFCDWLSPAAGDRLGQQHLVRDIRVYDSAAVRQIDSACSGSAHIWACGMLV
jgi:hypothetical protein